jgi:hypothetical protein
MSKKLAPREVVANGGGTMNPSDEFLKHAAECQKMAKFTRDPESKATWSRMAARWIDCAERFKSQREAAHRSPPRRHRRMVEDWAA